MVLGISAWTPRTMSTTWVSLTVWRRNRWRANLVAPNPQEVSMRTNIVGAFCAIAMVASANAAIREEPVTYTDGETTMKGFVVTTTRSQQSVPGS